MDSPCSPKALLLLGLFLLACSECQADVQVFAPAVMEVLLGHQVSILCEHKVSGGDGSLLVEWFITDKNGEQRRVAYSDQGQQGMDRGTEYTDRASMNSNHSLVIKAAEVVDERVFSCGVTAGPGGSGTGVTQLKVYGAPELPEVTPNTRTLSVTEEDTSEIATCTSKNANPVPTISWYKDEHPLNASTERNKELYVVSRTVKEASGLHSVSSTLYLRVNKADKDSTFRCKVSYSMPHGKVDSVESDPFQLTLHYYTENVQFVVDAPEVIKEGDAVKLRCEADGYPPPEYIFSKLQTEDIQIDLGSHFNGILHIPHVMKADSGTYRCQVLDFDSPNEVDLEKEVTIHINYLDPLVLNPSKMVMAKLGGSLELTCSGTGSQRPILSWKKGKEQVGEGETLALNSLNYHMAGRYTCEASVPTIPGLRRNQTVEVVVEGMPEVEKNQSTSHYQSVGQKVTFTCSALGYPEPEIRWSITGEEPSLKVSGNRVISELSLEVTPELAQSGVKCWAENKHGMDEQMFQLQLVSPTSPATPVPAVDGAESQGGSTVAVIAVCVCVLLLLLIVGFFYFMQRRGQLPCGGGEKRSLTPKEGNPDDTVVEMKTDKRNEQTGLLSPGGGGGGGPNEC
ncbi:basal cell adhesion molecule [Rhineura floridana]|uniref:basal cell adhesion molecule n=1 Tax=Rhineura floridana TaxID=261503 RepID=UPI002AC8023C|nr:basal cell adhesion molecule [Rhineura floridana]